LKDFMREVAEEKDREDKKDNEQVQP